MTQKELVDGITATGHGYLISRYAGSLLLKRVSSACADDVNYAILSGDTDRIAKAREIRQSWQANLLS